jgi:signal transduction histidine kinase
LFGAAGDQQGEQPTCSVHESAGRTFELTSSSVRTTDGESLGLVTVARDITDRLGMERHLMREDRLSVVGKLAATVAHEINNPIGVVSLYSQHALAKLSSESPVRKHLEIIRRNADSCRKIIGDLLQLARPTAPQRSRLDLRRLCAEVAEAVEPLAERSGVLLSSGDHERDAPILVDGDEDQIRQALLNLVLNGIEAAPPGAAVSVAAWEAQEGDATVRVIEVHDSGPGIPKDRLEQLFEPFFTTKATGTGLGLSVAKGIVETHFGHVEVESEMGEGTSFRMVLPAAVEQGGHALVQEISDRTSSRTSGPGAA